MYYPPGTHPAEREAERLRTVIVTLAESFPEMEMRVAKDVIFKSEAQAAELERQQVEPEIRNMTDLPNKDPETLSKFIDLQPDIQAEIPGRKINAIKMVRARVTVGGTPCGLKEAKEGVEAWEAGPKTPSVAAASATTAAQDIADWIEGATFAAKAVRDVYDDITLSAPKIQAIKECRAYHPGKPSLIDAKAGVERWIELYR